jgi:hypothetical protein
MTRQQGRTSFAHGLIAVLSLATIAACSSVFHIGPDPDPQASPAYTVTGSSDGLTATAGFEAATVEPGGSVDIDISVRNDRASPVVLGGGDCAGGLTVYGAVPVPLTPSGRPWSGLAGLFKTYALTNGYGPGGVPMAQPLWIYARAGHCGAEETDVTVAPGDTWTTWVRWTASYVTDLAALPGTIPFTISISHDPTGGPPTYPSGYHGPLASWTYEYTQLTILGSMAIVGPAPPVVSAGQAIDALLSLSRYQAWLEAQPASTWSNANVFLQSRSKAEGIVPAGPSWEVDLFRERGVPRSFAIGFVDANSGKVLNVSYCNNPCNR